MHVLHTPNWTNTSCPACGLRMTLVRSLCAPQCALCSRGPPKKNSWYHHGIFFGGYPQRGRAVPKKISAKIFPGPKKLRFLEIYPTPLNLEGANRILFKVSTDILTNVGGICGLIPRSDHAFFQDAALCGCITPALSGAQQWAELLRNPCVLGPQERGQNQSTAQQKQMGKNNLPLCNNPCWSSPTLSAARFEPRMWQTQHHCFSTKVQANSDSPLLRDGIDIWSNMFFTHY